MFLAIGCLSVATGGRGGGLHWGLKGREGGLGNSEVGGNSAGGGGVGAIVGGVKIGGGLSSTSKTRPSHHKYKSLKQFELKQS